MTDQDLLDRSDVAQGPAPLHVLVVEDDDGLREGLRRGLGRDFRVTALSDGANAAVMIMNTDYDVVLSDIGLPRLSGVDLLRMVRNRDLDVPVILMTASPSPETLRQALELGAFSYLNKPVPIDVLRATLLHAAKVSRIARLQREARAIEVGLTLGGERDVVATVFQRALATLAIHHQPIVDAKTRQTCGYEVLMRPQNPNVPHVGAMLQLAERLGRIDELGQKVRELAAASYPEDAKDVLLFVNLHPTELQDPHLYDASTPLGAIAKNVVLEITERSALSDVADTRRRTQQLREMGYRIAIDDLGAGYAGLSWFATLEPDIVKLDMSLIRGIDSSPIRARVVEKITALCHELGMRVVAEGIESAAELEHASALGCDLLQGYHLGRPAAGMVPSTTKW